MKNQMVIAIILSLVLSACGPKYTEEKKDTYILIKNEDGAQLGYSPESGVKVLDQDGYAFKDLNKNDTLDAYEDWRLPAEERAKDLASRMSLEQIAGLMLYSAHQAIPAVSGGYFGGTYNGKPFEESGAAPSDLNDAQLKFLTEDHLRHVLITGVSSPEDAALWNNKAQAFVEKMGLGIPVNTSSDPRHGADSYAEFNAGAGGEISMWPGTLGIAASFDPGLMQRFGEIASKEYRALGVATALSPQIDLGTEPRWSRFDGTMGEDPDLATDLARAYVDGFQSSDDGGWGFQSVNAMVKHWPGGGPEEGGRDGHFGYGAYAVYPGKNLSDQIKPFVEGVFKLEGDTGMASAVMPYYTISYGQDTKYGENVGNGYSKYLIEDVLRGEYNYDGVVCTDWGITRDVSAVDRFEGKPWGVEELSVAERHYKVIMAGVDQFGGNNDKGPVLEAYAMGVREHGEEFMRKRFERSAVRLLKNTFRVGLFENPYLDVEETKKIVGNPEFMEEGYQAQLRSVIMLKNHGNTLPLKKKQKVYAPQRYIAPSTNWFGMQQPEKTVDPFNLEVVKDYFEIVDSPQEADFALVGIESPNGGVGYDRIDLEKGGNGYVPISLQYGQYTASEARDVSIAGGSPLENSTDRAYKDKSFTAYNISDMALVNKTKEQMGEKPVVVVVKVANPMVFSEIEKSASGILAHMGVQDQVLMDLISGVAEPSALLPFQMPADMATVEKQFEDLPRDMVPYTDEDGNQYDFAFGLNWEGVIDDERVAKYK
ncbi:glycoside hydrolase family 3 protein [Muriicola marianensis]|uniref:beta-glucosidase n=1 Tax=Muriicola marianensis TaxID=1324801 RepID=A0ABQ1R6L0_9FLAO|nr:glycoside hydrolase family 3 N-terminal domain-containing protein [Muriicola marianensis]GGD56407.1 beta-glucosidase [Muriicola marianensis]